MDTLTICRDGTVSLRLQCLVQGFSRDLWSSAAPIRNISPFQIQSPDQLCQMSTAPHPPSDL